MARKKPDPPAPEPDDNQEEWRRPAVKARKRPAVYDPSIGWESH